MSKYGPAWAVIAQEIETRSADRATFSSSGPIVFRLGLIMTVCRMLQTLATLLGPRARPKQLVHRRGTRSICVNWCQATLTDMREQQNIALMNAVRTHESAWKDIQMLHFPSRSANNVKNQSVAPERFSNLVIEVHY